MIRYNYISSLGFLLHRFVSPSTGTHDGKLSVGLPRHPTIARNNIGNSSLVYAFRVRMPWARGYFVSTVGRDEAVIQRYIQDQEHEDKRLDQLSLLR
jgi:hypothetical protein